MRTIDQSGVGTTRLDRRDVLRRSAAGLAMPAALATAGLPAGEAVARVDRQRTRNEQDGTEA